MEDRNVDPYRTGQGVPINDEYICQSGQRLKLQENDDFPVCPISGEETTWRRGKVEIE
jgi:hypothetical protein